jgi:hypothetical protein
MWFLKRKRTIAQPKATRRLYEDCTELPITVFYRIVESGDLSHLTIDGQFTEEELQLRWDAIVREFEALTGKVTLQVQLQKNANDLAAVNRMNGLIALYYTIVYNGGGIEQDAEYWGVKPSREAVRMAIMREQTRLSILQAEKKKNAPATKSDFYDIWTAVENGLNRNIDVENCSVKKWVSLCRSLEEKVKHLSKSTKKWQTK